ncbi:MAG TPA: hypothetical protein VFN76_09890 [Candidatus Limnocylindria bacterium]|nr:hypothetical protein [Candidatus Limnocylindria bacterium]
MTHAAKRRRDERPASSMLPGDRLPTPEEMRAAARQGITVVELRRRLGTTNASDEDADRRARFSSSGPKTVKHEHYPLAPGEPEPYLSEHIDEKKEQEEVIKVFGAISFACYRISQPRATKQTPGLPDLRFFRDDIGLAVEWETKRQLGGEHTEAQVEYAAHCKACGIPHGSGDRYDAKRWLIARGLAEYVNGRFAPRPR